MQKLPPLGPEPVPQTGQDQAVVSTSRKPHKRIIAAILAILAIVFIGTGVWALNAKRTSKQSAAPAQTSTRQTIAASTKAGGVTLDPNKNYGNVYADGLLPVGDGKYVTDAPKAGYVYVCSGYANNIISEPGGAESRGPWFTNNNTEYDINKKPHVNGRVKWTPVFSDTVDGNNRIISTNDLPNHDTGVFPISNSDPAHAYDRNPNNISAQSLSYTLNANPSFGTPTCMGGEVGVMLTGVALFNGFDAGGRDAGAWEVQDSCSGHPQNHGEYHYHTLSSCITDVSVSNVIGYALDGFPITGPKVGDNNFLTTSDLDECHGLTSDITLNGKETTSYHYVMTQDFPYSISCFRSKPSQPPNRPAKT